MTSELSWTSKIWKSSLWKMASVAYLQSALPFVARRRHLLFVVYPRGVLVMIGGGDDVDGGGAGDRANVSHRFQPSGLFSWANSP